MTHYFKNVFIRDDLREAVKLTLTLSAIAGLKTEEIKNSFGEFCVKVANDATVREGLWEGYIYNPIKNLFSFGASDEEKFEAKLEEIKDEIIEEIKEEKEKMES